MCIYVSSPSTNNKSTCTSLPPFLSTKSHALCPHNPVCLHSKPHIQGKVGIKTYLMSKNQKKNQNDFVLRY